MTGTSTGPVPDVVSVGVSREWWQRLADSWAAWAGRHQTALRRLRLARAVWLWTGLAWLAVLAVTRPETREALSVFAQVYWLLVVWFLLSRTRTVSWRLVAGVFSVGLVWSLLSGLVLFRMAQAATAMEFSGVTVPGQVRALGPMVALAGVGEESLKLVPVAVLVMAAPGRVRRFSVTDWLLVGLASGLSFQALEELARRVAVQVRGPSLADVLIGVGERGPDSGYPQYGWSPTSGWSQWEVGTQFPGHHATTALVAVTVGLAVVAWRHARGRAGAVAVGWRAAALLAPAVMWWLVVSVHGGGNATGSVGDRWLTSDDPSVPFAIRAGWQAANHGVGLRWLLLLLLVVALLVDARLMQVAGRRRSDGEMVALPFSPAERAEAWTARITGQRAPRAVSLPVGAGCALVAYVVRDLACLIAAHAREPGEARIRALARGRAAGAMMRAVRENAMAEAAGPPPRGDGHRRRLTGLTALAVLALAIFWLGPAWAERIGTSPDVRSPAADGADAASVWLAGILDSLGSWWDGQSTGSKIAVGVGIAALVALSGGSLGLAIGVSGVATYLLAHGHGAADFVRDPRDATRAYLATTTPTGVVADGAEALLTFGPWSFAGAATGRGIRIAAEEYARDPALFLARRRAATTGDVGSVELPGGGRLDPGQLAEHEIRQATEIVDYRGGHFVGVPRRDAPGIDGYLDDVPVSLKETTGRSPVAVLSHVSKAERQAANAGYSGVDVYVRAENLTRERLLDFARTGELAKIPSQGVVRAIHIRAGDGWLTIPGDLT